MRHSVSAVTANANSATMIKVDEGELEPTSRLSEETERDLGVDEDCLEDSLVESTEDNIQHHVVHSFGV